MVLGPVGSRGRIQKMTSISILEERAGPSLTVTKPVFLLVKWEYFPDRILSEDPW